MEILNSKTFKILICLLGLTISYYLSELYLSSNFEYFGESYRKGLGHLLWENFTKGFFFVFTKELLLSFFLSSIIYFSIGNEIHSISKKIILPIWILILIPITIYIGIKVYDVYSWGYDGKNRIIEISLTWYTRALGFYISYLLISKLVHIEREKHYC